MQRLIGMSVSVAIAFGLIGSTHWYIWARLVRDTSMGAPWGQLCTLGIAALGANIPVTLLLARLLPSPFSKAIAGLTFCWMGLFFILLCLMLGADAVRLLSFGLRRFVLAAPALPAAQQLQLMRLGGSAVAALSCLLAVQALRMALCGPALVRVEVQLERLPKDLSGLTIAQISDLHVAPLLGRGYVERLVAQVQAAQPSLIAITGDLVDGSVAQLRGSVAPLAALQAPHGVYFVTGNHEYYSGADAWIAELRRLGIVVLRNERVSIGHAEQSFDLAGVDDVTAHHHLAGHGSDLQKALAGRDPKRELVLLAHQPKAIFQAAQYGVGLMLSGHTHGGQIWPFGYIVRLVQPYLAGLARLGATQIYVNRGSGFWGPPMRLWHPPELTLLTLRAATAGMQSSRQAG